MRGCTRLNLIPTRSNNEIETLDDNAEIHNPKGIKFKNTTIKNTKKTKA